MKKIIFLFFDKILPLQWKVAFAAAAESDFLPLQRPFFLKKNIAAAAERTQRMPTPGEKKPSFSSQASVNYPGSIKTISFGNKNQNRESLWGSIDPAKKILAVCKKMVDFLNCIIFLRTQNDFFLPKF